MTVIPEASMTVSSDGRKIAVELASLEVIDQPKWPAHGAPTTPARLSYRIEWDATDEVATYDDPSKMFRINGWRATARLQAMVEVPSIGFSWKSDPMATSSAAFGFIGEESNGRYYKMP